MTGDVITVDGQPHRVVSEVMVRYPVDEIAEQKAQRIARGLAAPEWGYVALRVEACDG
jgi:hypothetical protein